MIKIGEIIKKTFNNLIIRWENKVLINYCTKNKDFNDIFARNLIFPKIKLKLLPGIHLSFKNGEISMNQIESPLTHYWVIMAFSNQQKHKSC